MKSNSLTYILVVLAAFCLGCEKFEDDTVDFSNRYPAYVDFAANTALTAAEGKAATFQVNIRPIQYQDVTVNYTVTGAVNTTGQAVIPSGTSNVRFTVPAPPTNGKPASAKPIHPCPICNQPTRDIPAHDPHNPSSSVVL